MDPIFIFFLVMLVFLYLLLIRPQRQQAKRAQEMLQNLQIGDEVITAGASTARSPASTTSVCSSRSTLT